MDGNFLFAETFKRDFCRNFYQKASCFILPEPSQAPTTNELDCREQRGGLQKSFSAFRSNAGSIHIHYGCLIGCLVDCLPASLVDPSSPLRW